MKNVLVKHIMDKGFRRMALDVAFLEALSLSSGCASEIEKQENSLLEYLREYPNFIQNITEEYKLKVLKCWEYEVIVAAEKSNMRDISTKTLEEWQINDYGRVENIILGQTFAIVKAENGDVSLVETSDRDAIIMGIELEDISRNYNEKRRTIILEEEVYIANIDVCTSEATIYFTNDTQVTVELERDEDNVDNSDYDNIVLGRKVIYN